MCTNRQFSTKTKCIKDLILFTLIAFRSIDTTRDSEKDPPKTIGYVYLHVYIRTYVLLGVENGEKDKTFELYF
jgi:hypothetical protein